MEITFRDEQHEALFRYVLKKMNITLTSDVERASLAYLITMDEVCRDHVEEIYNFECSCINLNSLRKAWVTSSSKRTLLLAFNLYNGYSTNSNRVSVLDIFSGGYKKYYVQAIRIRFPHGEF